MLACMYGALDAWIFWKESAIMGENEGEKGSEKEKGMLHRGHCLPSLKRRYFIQYIYTLGKPCIDLFMVKSPDG